MNHLLLAACAVLLSGCTQRIDLVGGAEPSPAPPEPVFSLSFEEGAGASVMDGVSGLDGALHGGSWVSDGAKGTALHLEPGEYLEFPNQIDASADFALALWLRFDAVDTGTKRGTILSTELLDQGGWQLHGNDDGTTPDLDFGYRKPARFTDFPRYVTLDCCALAPQTWRHVAVVLDAQQLLLTFYLDGVPDASRSVETLIQAGDSILYIGAWRETFDPARNDPRWFTGSLDEVRVFAAALSRSQVAALARREATDKN